MRNIIALLMIIALWCDGSSGFAALAEGRVVNGDNEPLYAVSIVTNLPDIGTLTDSEGNFRLNLPSDITRITFSSVGYHPRQFKPGNLPAVVVLERQYYKGGNVLVTADRAESGVTPVAFSNVTAEQIQRDYAVAEFPLLLASTPNVFTFTDGGAPLGYSYTTIRGFDDKRVATYINGVPLNDPEDQATYYVDLPDFASNVSDIQVQRGVGNSLYGDASFGGSINVVTNTLSRERMTRITSGYGEFTHNGSSVSDIYKQSVEYSSGLIDGQWHFAGRFSRQRTGGYRHNSWYEGWGYYFSMARLDPNMTTELYVYGGPIRMHLSYWGAPRSEITRDRRYNPLNYENETDNFNQPHYHLHNRWRLNDNTIFTNTLYYIRGKGYYEQLKYGQSFSDYNIDPTLVNTDPGTGLPFEEGNLVRQQWVKKNQWGWNPRLDITHDRGRHSFGGSFYLFESNHWGQVVWAQNIGGALNPWHQYYHYYGDKTQASVYAQEIYRLTDRLSTQVTAQLRYQSYSFDQERMGAFTGYDYDLNWAFFSPRIGLTYTFNEHLSVYTNFAISSRTPTDASIYDANDPSILPSLEIESVNADSSVYSFGDPLVDNERVYDFELGGSYRHTHVTFEATLFWMEFRNEIVPFGGINANTGLPITVNADRSVHAGVELAASVQPTEQLTVGGNLSYNYNRIKEYVADIDGTPVDFADKKTTGFPDYLANVTVDYMLADWRFTATTRFVGRRYMELENIEELSLNPYSLASFAVQYTFTELLTLGDVRLSGRIDNLFDKKYETSGYGGNYMDGDTVAGWAEYFVAAERSFYVQAALELF